LSTLGPTVLVAFVKHYYYLVHRFPDSISFDVCLKIFVPILASLLLGPSPTSRALPATVGPNDK